MHQENKQTDSEQVTLVHKGFFYYVFKLLFLPFKGIAILIKKAGYFVKIYLSWYSDYSIWKRKQKNLNKILSENKLKGEII